jgi:hypothetical protein
VAGPDGLRFIAGGAGRWVQMSMREEADLLVELFAACDRVLADSGENTDELTAAIRETREAVERRLAELGVVADAP